MNIWLAEIWRAWRASLRRPGFLLLAAGVLTLGIGASVAVFTLIDQVLLQPLPIPEPSRVVVMGPIEDGQVSAGSISPMQYQHLARLPDVASIGIAFSGPSANIAGGNGSPVVVSATYIDQGVLPALGLRPILGRNFNSAETAPHGPYVALLSHDLWERRFGGSPAALGQTLEVNGHTTRIVGVLPAAFGALSDFGASIVLPFRLPANSTSDASNETAVARLAAGVSVHSVSAEVNARLHAMYASMGSSRDARYGLRQSYGAQSLAASQNSGAHAKLTLFMACALLVLLTALVNLVNLMLLRSLSHAHDSAVRGALGAPPLRLALPSLAEGLLVGVIGALVGTGLAWIGLHALDGTVSTDWLPSGSLHMPWWMWLLALLVAIVVATGAAALGVWRTQATSAGDELREGGRSGLGRHAGRLGRVLVVVQMVLATVLLCGTGLLLHGLYNAANTPLEFSPAHILTFDLAPLATDYPNAQAVDALSQRLVRGFRQIPGVSAAVATTNLPTGEQFNIPVSNPGGRVPMKNSQFRAVGPGFFKLFNIRVLKGRDFNRGDTHGAEPVAIVNRALAEKIFNGHALGHQVEFPFTGSNSGPLSARVVGVVADTRQSGPLVPAPPAVYVPLSQVPDGLLAAFRSFEPLRFALRGHGNPNEWRSAIHTAMLEGAPNQPISRLRTMDDIVRGTTSATRTTLLLVSVFAALALLLSVAGMYAVMAVSVTARAREFGIRTALGATPSRLTWLVLRGGLVQILIGLVLGIAIVLGVSSLLVQMLTDLIGRANTFDPAALIGTCIVLAIAGVAACLLPAWRAGRVQPMNALRGE